MLPLHTSTSAAILSYAAIGRPAGLPLHLVADPAGSGRRGVPRDGASPSEDPRARLEGAHILLVEDEAMVAMEVEFALKDAGAAVLGPAASLAQALDLVRDAGRIDAAILDVDLGGDDVFPLADLLTARAVPFVFHTGVGRREEMAARFPNAGLCLKPVAAEVLLNDLASLMA